MNFWLFIFLLFLMVGRAAQVAACFAAALAESAVRAGIFLRYLLVHKYILQPLSLLQYHLFVPSKSRNYVLPGIRYN